MVYTHVVTLSLEYYGVPNVSKTLTNAIFVYLPLIYKCDTDLAKYLPDLLYYIYVRFINVDPIYISAGYINMGQIYIFETDLHIGLIYIAI